MKITHSTKVTASEERPWYVVDYKIPDDPEFIKREERRRMQRELADEEDAYDLEHGEGIYSSESAAPAIKPAGGDMINYVMVYTGPGYEENTPQAVLEWGRKNGFDKMFWGSDTAYRMNGMYNGDTYVLYKDANKLPAGYKEDALDAEEHNRVMSSTEIEGATAEELQKKFAEYQKMNEQLGKQLDDLQNDQLSKFKKAQEPKKKGFFKRAFAADDIPESRCHKVAEDDDSIEYVVSSEEIMCKSQWMGKYLTPSGQVKKVYFDLDTEDWNEAVEEFENIIPEPYQSAKLLGKAPINIESDDTFMHIEGAMNQASKNPGAIEELENRLKAEIHRYMVDVGGFDEEDDPNDRWSMGADNFWRLSIEPTTSEGGTKGIYIELGAELGYDSMDQLLDRLNPIVQEYDDEAYFEPYDPGISVCYLWDEDVSASTDIEAAYPVGTGADRDDWLDPDYGVDQSEPLDDIEQVVNIDLDVDIDMKDDGSYEYASLDFAKDPGHRDGSYHIEVDGLEDDLILRDYISVVEDLDELLLYKLPNEKGKHHITGEAELVYIISGLSQDAEGNVFADHLDVNFDRNKSEIKKFKIE